MGRNKNKLNIFTTLALIIFCLGVFIDSAQAADIEASASRTSGVAPLSVHFNADLTASSETERSFHDLQYSWNFGDANAGNWGTNDKPKNEDKGPVAAHVYETPGTFTATLTVRDVTGIISTKTFEITVEDPDVVFAGINTICISDVTSNDFTGCPAGAQNIATDSLADMPTWAVSGKRVLLRRGSAWNTSTELVGNTHVTQARIGAYGTCEGPDANGICVNAPQISLLTKNVSIFSLTYKHDFIIHDLSFVSEKFGDSNAPEGITTGTVDFSEILLLRNKSRGFYVPISVYHKQTEIYQTAPTNVTVVSCDIRDSYGITLYVGGENLSVMGNQIHNSDVTHVTRVWWAYKGVYSHNMVSGASLTNTAGRAALKFHGPMAETSPFVEEYPTKIKDVGTFSEIGSNALPFSTQYVVVSDNVFGSSGPWPVAIRPQDSFSDERIYDVIFERNRLVQDYGDHSAVPWNNPLRLNGYYLTVRNNVIDASYLDISSNGITPIALEAFDDFPVRPHPVGIQIYNNTVYNNGAAFVNHVTSIAVEPSYTDVQVRNNYFVFTDAIPAIRINDQTGMAVFSNNIFSKNSYFTDPDNSTPLFRDFSLLLSATDAINQGHAVPVFDDFTRQSRAGVYDIGAYKYTEITSFRADVDNSSVITTTDALLTLRNSLGLDMSVTAWQVSATTGDVNCDGVSNSTDALLILRYSLGLDMSITNWCE